MISWIVGGPLPIPGGFVFYPFIQPIKLVPLAEVIFRSGFE